MKGMIGGWGSLGETTRANVFVAICFRAVSDFCKEERRSTSAVRFSDRRSISRQIEFFRRSKNAVYKPAGQREISVL